MKTIVCHTCKRMWNMTGSYRDSDTLLLIYQHWILGHILENYEPEEMTIH